MCIHLRMRKTGADAVVESNPGVQGYVRLLMEEQPRQDLGGCFTTDYFQRFYFPL